jgi:hypothetical protein
MRCRVAFAARRRGSCSPRPPNPPPLCRCCPASSGQHPVLPVCLVGRLDPLIFGADVRCANSDWAWGLARRHAERLRQLRDKPLDARPAVPDPPPPPASAQACGSRSVDRLLSREPLTGGDEARGRGRMDALRACRPIPVSSGRFTGGDRRASAVRPPAMPASDVSRCGVGRSRVNGRAVTTSLCRRLPSPASSPANCGLAGVLIGQPCFPRATGPPCRTSMQLKAMIWAAVGGRPMNARGPSDGESSRSAFMETEPGRPILIERSQMHSADARWCQKNPARIRAADCSVRRWRRRG